MILTVEQFEQNSLGPMPPPVEGVSLQGQVVVVMGANTGLGFEAAKHFAIRGPRKLVLVCRNEKKGQDAVQRIRTDTGFQNIELWIVDLTSFQSVKAIKDKVDQLERLDILVENAAIATSEYQLTGDGWDDSLQANLLGPALHLLLHLPKLLETTKKYPETTPRIVWVSSDIHYRAEEPLKEILDAPNSLEFLNDKAYWARNPGYPESKVLALMFARALQSRLSEITCCSVNPALCHTELKRNSHGEQGERLQAYLDKYGYTAEEGSRQLLYAAIGQRDREEEVRGSYISYSRVSECSDLILSDEGQQLERRLWKEVLEVLERVASVAQSIINEHLRV
ncbi:hypothetical protein AAF712_004576 [Marasmius tenuissimus]|uniref:Short-chain dehydrogenase n=1 Tax=Marasmius tenuissimus TaxID=585030 RepID=A0ABR3A4H3_9AGAR